MKWLVSGDADEKQPVPAIVPFFRQVRQEP
jgi:hypothetical protein